MKAVQMCCVVAGALILSVCGADGVRPTVMDVLPLGSVRPAGFLRERLENQASGLTGHAEALYDDIGRSDWLTGAGKGGEFAWERGPYYAKGLVALAFVLDDPALKAKARRWVDAILASQRADGDFGPKARNWWANMIALTLLRDWTEATGDARTIPFMERYFAFQRTAFATHPLAADSRWAVARAGDEMEIALWLHAKTGNDVWRAFADDLSAQSTDWARYYRRGGNPGHGDRANGYSSHIVNFMQGLKTPALQWRLDGDDAKRTAYQAAFAPDGWLMTGYGRPDRMLNGTEPLSSRSASEGTELCAVAERLVSTQIQAATFGDGEAADDLETVAYNTLMGLVTADGRGVAYYGLLNEPACLDKPLGFAFNGAGVASICPGPHPGFGCCRSNFHMAWPKFVQSMWMARDGGLAAVAYGPCTVSTPVATIAETGGYPFGADVRLEVTAAKGGAWPLFVKIPGWCGAARVAVNGADAGEAAAGTFKRIVRDWRAGDVVTLAFPLETRLSHWENDALAVRRGPLLYALKIAEDDRPVTRYKVPHETRWVEDGDNGFPRHDIHPASPWGYALLRAADGRLAGETLSGDGLGTELTVQAVRTDFGGWGYMRCGFSARAVDPPPSPVPDDGAPVETVTLVPFGATRIRIALFPWRPARE